MLVLSKSQFKILSNFFADVAKGLFLGVAINQTILSGPVLIKLLNSLIGVIATLLFLYLSLSFSKPNKYD